MACPDRQKAPRLLEPGVTTMSKFLKLIKNEKGATAI